MLQKAINIIDLRELIDLSVKVDMLSDNDLVNIINQCGDYLNLISPKDYAKVNSVSPVSANKETKTRKIVKIFNTKFISEIF